MGKRHVHVIEVRKSVTIALLALTTIAMAGLLYFLSGKAYAPGAHPVRDLLARMLSGPRAISADALLASLTPAIANMLLFVPWGFFAFIAFDNPLRRPRRLAYALTFLAATGFALVMYGWQRFLPTQVTALPDTISNALGALAGAALGHARKTVRVRFDF